MTRFVTKAAALTAAVFPLVSTGVAGAQSQAVDEKTGPVSFANIASVRISTQGQPGGALITETQRSPLLPGQSKLGSDRVSVPKDDGERKTFGGHYQIDLGRYSNGNPYPSGVASRDHNVVAALQATTVPTAVAETNYALRDTWQGGAKAIDSTVLVLEGAKTSVDCTGPGKLTGTSTLSRLWVRQGGSLGIVPMPAGNAGLQLKNLRLGPPGDITNASKETTLSDLKLTRVGAFDQLIRQDGWRGGDFTAVAGWRAEITTHVKDASGAALQDVQTSIVLGGVSCSVPKGFVAKAGNQAGGANASQAPVPTQVPAGYLGAAAPDTGSDGSRVPLSIGLLFGGVFFGAVALLLGRRRKSGTD
ncbi:LPXTG cell wall anchor domain-containing protein [Amycolatopsis sp. OK19-0408]|uniref:LPXTG cell wall anchor domain-containing protein n=1 Tax=Amycolatopsis iheyensis TaxID=2945988 RepID=A0A9X2NAQ6_9PSEU|nr:LPXTG cell wall anchor domain-containing protein [Amycolatopsis iheyensis]MCR6483244.1 LPXTG cell wall anchor domain-containing protein [Amycolatopsis iheyensis]